MKFPRLSPRVALFVASIAAFAALSFFLWESPQSANEPPRTAFYSQFAVADDITGVIRDRAKSLVRVRVESQKDRQAASKLGQIIADHGSDVLIAANSLPPSLPDEASVVGTSINLPGKSFEPLKEMSVGTIAPEGFVPETGYYIVQFGVTPTDELLDSLRDAGSEIVQYIPHQAFIVYGSGDSISKAAKHSRVRWTGRFLPEYKPSKTLREQLSMLRSIRKPKRSPISQIEKTGRSSAIFDVAVFANADLGSAAHEITVATGGRAVKVIDLPNNFFNIVRIEADVSRIEDASQVEAVYSIESWSKPKKEDEVAAQIVAGNYVGNVVDPPGYDPLAQFGVNGQGVTVAVADDGVGIPGDGGFYVTASNAKDGPLRGAAVGANGHGHLQASIIAGDTPFSILDPNNYNYGSGIAPKANIVNIPILRFGYTGSEADSANDAILSTGPNGVIGSISNNSWGNDTNGNVYDAYTAQFDGFVRDASSAGSIDPLTLVFSAGNSGNSGLTRPKVAKNIIAVAATENIRPTLPTSGGTTGVADNLEQVPDFSSRGPAADGRVKPDISAPGAAVTGGRSGPGIIGMSNIDTFHRVSSGTSHAAPQVAGAAALFTEFWKGNNAGSNPSPAIVKAALINGAVEVTGAGALSSRPNGSEGWGRINLKNVLNTGASMSYFDQTTTLNSVGDIRNFIGTVPDNSRPVRVSLVWTDPPGAADPPLVNDLDLEVLIGGHKYLGNFLSSGSSVAGGSADSLNNVENVFLPAGISGPVTIRVIAKALNGDGVLGDADTTDQHFALVVYNGSSALSTGPSPEAGQPSVVSGNNLLEPSECNFVTIPLTNYGQSTMTAVSANLSTTTPGVNVLGAFATYPNIAPGATANSSPFQLSTSNTVACASNVDLVLTVSYAEMAAPAVFNYSIRVGGTPAENYSFATSAGATISAGGTLVPGSDEDDVVVPFTVPFSFSVYDTAVPAGSTIRLSTDGQIRIESAGSSDSAQSNESLPSDGGSGSPFATNLPVLLPYWDDLDMRDTTTIGGGIFAEVTGSPGSQILKLEWRARNFFAGQTLATPNVQFAVYFHENSNAFEYVYAETGRSGAAFVSGSSATVGVQGTTAGSTFTQFSSNTPSLSQGLMISATRPGGTCIPGFGPCVLTAAKVSISGRVVTREGRGVRGVTVSVTDAEGRSFRAMSSSLGYFRIEGVPAGQGLVLNAYSRNYTFAPSLFDVMSDLSGLVLVAER